MALEVNMNRLLGRLHGSSGTSTHVWDVELKVMGMHGGIRDRDIEIGGKTRGRTVFWPP